MANRWRKNGHSDRFIFLGSKNTADGDCSHEIKRCLLLGRKAMTNLDSESKSWDVTLMTKSPYSQSVSSSCVWTLCNPVDCSPSGSSVHEISQARILEWVAISISRGSFQLRDRTWVSFIGRQILYQLHHLGSLLKWVGVKTQLKRYRDADPVHSTLGMWGPSVWWLLLISSGAFSLICGRKKGEGTSIY